MPQGFGPRLAALWVAMALLWWAGRALVAEPGARRLAGQLLEGMTWAAARTPLRRPGLGQRVGRGVALDALPWFSRLARGDPDRGLRLLAGLRLVTLVVALLSAGALTAAAGPGIAPLAGVLGVAAPLSLDVRLALAIRAVQCRLDEQLPLAVELLGVSLGAGQSLQRALDGCAAEVDRPLRTVFTRVGLRVATGVSAGDALREEAGRTGAAGLDRVAAVLDRGTTLGLAMGAPLHSLAEELRAGWRSAVTARAGRATPLAALVTALVIAPACVGALAVCLIGAVLAQGAGLG